MSSYDNDHLPSKDWLDQIAIEGSTIAIRTDEETHKYRITVEKL